MTYLNIIRYIKIALVYIIKYLDINNLIDELKNNLIRQMLYLQK